MYSTVPLGTRFWVHINDQNANPWDCNGTVIPQLPGMLHATVDNTDPFADKAVLLLGNSPITSHQNDNDIVASYELVASNEDIEIKDITLIANDYGELEFLVGVDTLVLYRYNSNTQVFTEIAQESVTSNIVNFDDIDYLVEEGVENIYVKAIARRIGFNYPGQQTRDIDLTMHVTDAEGVESNTTVLGDDGTTEISATNPIATNESHDFAVVPVMISDVEFVSNYGGISLDNLSTTPYNAAILKVTTASSTNIDQDDGSSLRTELVTLKLEVEYTRNGYSSGDIFTLKKIGSSDNVGITAALGPATSPGTLSFTLTDGFTSADEFINNGSISAYVLEAPGFGVVTTNSTVTVNLIDMDSGAPGEAIDYRSDDTEMNDLIAPLRLQANEVNGIVITD